MLKILQKWDLRQHCSALINIAAAWDFVQDATVLRTQHAWQIYLYSLLPVTSDGINVNTPLSEKSISLEYVFEHALGCSLILYGGECEALERFARENGIEAINYYEREDYKVANAVPTAEGAVSIAVDEMPGTIYGADCLILGYGRNRKGIGQTFARFWRKSLRSRKKK